MNNFHNDKDTGHFYGWDVVKLNPCRRKFILEILGISSDSPYLLLDKDCCNCEECVKAYQK